MGKHTARLGRSRSPCCRSSPGRICKGQEQTFSASGHTSMSGPSCIPHCPGWSNLACGPVCRLLISLSAVSVSAQWACLGWGGGWRGWRLDGQKLENFNALYPKAAWISLPLRAVPTFLLPNQSPPRGTFLRTGHLSLQFKKTFL